MRPSLKLEFVISIVFQNGCLVMLVDMYSEVDLDVIDSM